jgi:hypothetical protein
MWKSLHLLAIVLVIVCVCEANNTQDGEVNIFNIFLHNFLILNVPQINTSKQIRLPGVIFKQRDKSTVLSCYMPDLLIRFDSTVSQIMGITT